jgi:hypothetical protein|tara:strand:- start:5161 stop:6021 length:861 start_codon:yes stop_codon:yes gene_type:complete
MNKKICISTWCTDDYKDFLGVDKLANSIKYFHPEVDHVIVDTNMTNEINEKYSPWMRDIWMMAPTCLPYADDYDMVIHLDADAVVTGPMTELFECDADVIGVRNNNSFDKAGSGNGITITHLPPFGNGQQIPIQGFINAGLVAVNNKEFWEDWHDVNYQSAKIKETNPCAHGLGDENDTLNQIFHNSSYTSKVIDEIGSGVSYGLSSCWGNGHNNHWESWSQIYVKDDRLWIDDPVIQETMCIKVMHQAGGHAAAQLNRGAGGFRNWLSSVVSDEVNDYLNEVQNG